MNTTSLFKEHWHSDAPFDAHAPRTYSALQLAALILMMQYLTLENNVNLRSIGSLLKTLSPAGYHNPRLKRLERYSSVLQLGTAELQAPSAPMAPALLADPAQGQGARPCLRETRGSQDLPLVSPQPSTSAVTPNNMRNKIGRSPQMCAQSINDFL